MFDQLSDILPVAMTLGNFILLSVHLVHQTFFILENSLTLAASHCASHDALQN